MVTFKSLEMITDLLLQNGYKLKAHTNGGEYKGPCPFCGGTDRFYIQPNHNNQKGFWQCRVCDRRGDNIQYLRDVHGMDFKTACDFVRYDHGQSNILKEGPTKQRSSEWIPRESCQPPFAWQEKAQKFIRWAEETLWDHRGAGVRKLLKKKWGLNSKTIEQFHLGLNPRDMFLNRILWGLPEEIKENGNPRKLWLPAGIIIPVFKNEGVQKIKIRRFVNNHQDKKYIHVSGGSTGPALWYGTGMADASILVESELDALLLCQECEDIMRSVVALGSAQIRPDLIAFNVLDQSETLLIALDADEAGAKATWFWWLKHFPRAKRWPVVGGKDPAEAYLNGLDLRAWLLAGLPAQIQ